MKSVATLTMNPTIDAASIVDEVRPTHKMRARDEDYAPGGGGINVARVYARLGGRATSVHLSGGATGVALGGLLAQLARAEGFTSVGVEIRGSTRVVTTIREQSTGREFRFVPEGPVVSAEEADRGLERLMQAGGDIAVLSGSLPRGVPADFYARAAARLGAVGMPVVLDSSGTALAAAVEAGGLMVVKPSRSELAALTGKPLADDEALARAAMAIVEAGKARLVAVTMGARGALLARKEGALFMAAPVVEEGSAVGAGDSFVAGMVASLASGGSDAEALRDGIAAGAAAAITPGSDLALAEDFRRLKAAMAAP